jgi:hypothetical protein
MRSIRRRGKCSPVGPGSPEEMPRAPSTALRAVPLPRFAGEDASGDAGRAIHATPSFFCRLVDEVVYWNTRRLSGKI